MFIFLSGCSARVCGRLIGQISQVLVAFSGQLLAINGVTIKERDGATKGGGFKNQGSCIIPQLYRTS